MCVSRNPNPNRHRHPNPNPNPNTNPNTNSNTHTECLFFMIWLPGIGHGNTCCGSRQRTRIPLTKA
eukprot:1351921-Amorphochlora_amoeboformis.AAC.1